MKTIRVITSIQLAFTPGSPLPEAAYVRFEDVADGGGIARGVAEFLGDEAAGVFSAENLAYVLSAIEERGDKVNEPGAVAERIAAATEAETRTRAAVAAARDAADAQKAAETKADAASFAMADASTFCSPTSACR